MSGSQPLPLEFLKFLQIQLLRLSQNPKHNKNRPSGHDCHFYSSIKQIITFGIVRKFFLSGRIKKHATEEF